MHSYYKLQMLNSEGEMVDCGDHGFATETELVSEYGSQYLIDRADKCQIVQTIVLSYRYQKIGLVWLLREDSC